MKNLVAIFIFVCPIVVLAKSVTDSFGIKGKVKKEITITLTDLQTAPSQSLEDACKEFERNNSSTHSINSFL